MNFTLIICVGVLLSVLPGCSRPLLVTTTLTEQEEVHQGDTVFIDGAAAGQVKSLERVGTERIATLAITNKAEADAKMKIGVFRVGNSGRIEFKSDAVTADAKPLAPGSLIPMKTKLEYSVIRYGTRETAIVIGLACVVVLILVFILKRLLSVGIVIVTITLALGTAWIFQPIATPFVEDAYANFLAKSGDRRELPQASTPSTTVETQSGESGLIKNEPSLADPITKIISISRADPRWVAFVGLFLLSWIVYSMVFRACTRPFRKG
ncbi:MAG: hypothetical protein O2960_12860 [Verrucomicrobia bacterium]|nr:hypothetical protein [Verrucomicrobiota bacterium]